jgi:hypothetical protein
VHAEQFGTCATDAVPRKRNQTNPLPPGGRASIGAMIVAIDGVNTTMCSDSIVFKHDLGG